MKSAVKIIERRHREATLKLQGRKAKPVYLAAVRPSDTWLVDGIAERVDELPEIHGLTTSGLNEEQLVDALLRIEPGLEGARCDAIFLEPGRFRWALDYRSGFFDGRRVGALVSSLGKGVVEVSTLTGRSFSFCCSTSRFDGSLKIRPRSG